MNLKSSISTTTAILAFSLCNSSLVASSLNKSKPLAETDVPFHQRSRSNFKDEQNWKKGRWLENVWWEQVGMDLLGEGRKDYFGYSVGMSKDGKRVVVGAINNDGNGIDSGHVRVFEEVFGSWMQVGEDIDGEEIRDWSGHSVSMNSNGKRIIIGAYANNGNGCNSGHTRVYEEVDNEWIQIGDDIDGEQEKDYSGSSVDMNSDGTMVIIGAPRNAQRGDQAGHARVFREEDGNWVQVGTDLDAEKSMNFYGSAVGMNSDGKRVIVGGPGNSAWGDNTHQIGHVRIFYLVADQYWVQLGNDVDGEISQDESGVSVDINDSGKRVVVGASFNDGNGTDSGHARVYEEQDNNWVQVGNDIDGEAAEDHSGNSVQMSSDGKSVVIGAKLNDGGGSGSNKGHARVYHEVDGTWFQIGNDIDGYSSNDQAGFSVGMNSDATRVIIGSPFHEGNGEEDSGLAQVFSILSDNPSSPSPPNAPNTSPNPVPSPLIEKPSPNSSSSLHFYPTALLLGAMTTFLLF